MLRIELTTELEAPANAVWSALRKTETFRYVATPLLCLEADLPPRWPDSGGAIRVGRLRLLCAVPAWSHEMWFVHLDGEGYEMLTSERGGPIREWNHRIRVEPLSERICRYTDEVGVRAGVLTPLVWFFCPTVLSQPADALAWAGPPLRLVAPTFREFIFQALG